MLVPERDSTSCCALGAQGPHPETRQAPAKTDMRRRGHFGRRALAMEDDAKHEISRQLAALREGGGADADAWHDLVPLVYDELHAMARRQLHRERDSHTLNTTALVHEAYLRLVKQRAHWLDRAQFFAIAARVMRRILIDYARQHRATKRGGRDARVAIDSLD